MPHFYPDAAAYIEIFSTSSSEIWALRDLRAAHPGPRGKWPISTGGGGYPKWSRNGKELFYRTVVHLEDSKIMAVTYTASGDSFQLWSPRQFRYNFNFAQNRPL